MMFGVVTPPREERVACCTVRETNPERSSQCTRDSGVDERICVNEAPVFSASVNVFTHKHGCAISQFKQQKEQEQHSQNPNPERQPRKLRRRLRRKKATTTNTLEFCCCFRRFFFFFFFLLLPGAHEHVGVNFVSQIGHLFIFN
jgi:hypothetical protein